MGARFYFFDFIDSLGRWVVEKAAYFQELLLLIYLSFRSALVYRHQSLRAIFSVVFSQVYYTGVQSLMLISWLAMATSFVVVLQASSQFNILGGTSAIGQMIVTVVVREIAPLLTALIVIARSGTAVASELGNMRVNREVDALEVMGIDPLSYIVFPRLAGGLISVLSLSLYFIYVVIISGFVFSKIFMGLSMGYYVEAIMQVFTFEDVYLFALKNLFGGLSIFAICSYHGMQVKDGPHEVPQVTTKAVVNSIISVVVFNLLVTILFYLNQLVRLGVI